LIEIALRLSKQLETQSLACDFIFDNFSNPLLIEISYGFLPGSMYENCQGYWTDDLKWHDEKVLPETFIIEDFIKSLMNDNG